jgi:hypothetical protein
MNDGVCLSSRANFFHVRGDSLISYQGPPRFLRSLAMMVVRVNQNERGSRWVHPREESFQPNRVKLKRARMKTEIASSQQTLLATPALVPGASVTKYMRLNQNERGSRWLHPREVSRQPNRIKSKRAGTNPLVLT